jgi:hypothetical protein
MPTVFRIQCTSCGGAPSSDGGVATHVAFDGRRDGAILPEAYLAFRRDNGELVSLPHPGEGRRLQAEGSTFGKASEQGRLFRVAFKVCAACGAMHEEIQHCERQSGCLAGLVSGTLVFVGLTWATHLSWIVAFIGGWLGMLAGGAFAAFLHRPRWKKEENEEMKIKRCAKCGETKLASLYEVAGKTLPCPECGGASMQYSIAGKS